MGDGVNGGKEGEDRRTFVAVMVDGGGGVWFGYHDCVGGLADGCGVGDWW